MGRRTNPRSKPPTDPATRFINTMMMTAPCSSDSDGVGPEGTGISSKMARICESPRKNGVPRTPARVPAVAACPSFPWRTYAATAPPMKAPMTVEKGKSTVLRIVDNNPPTTRPPKVAVPISRPLSDIWNHLANIASCFKMLYSVYPDLSVIYSQHYRTDVHSFVPRLGYELASETFTLPRGMKDIEPDEMNRRLWLYERIREVVRKYGFQIMEPSTIENLKTLEAKSGPTIRNEIYWFKDKAGRSIGLRFDLTVGLAHSRKSF